MAHQTIVRSGNPRATHSDIASISGKPSADLNAFADDSEERTLRSADSAGAGGVGQSGDGFHVIDRKRDDLPFRQFREILGQVKVHSAALKKANLSLRDRFFHFKIVGFTSSAT